MTRSNAHSPGFMIAAACAAAAIATPASAELPQVDGTYWAKSTVEQKQAYLVGVANLLAVNQAVQQKRGTVDENAPLTRYLRAADATTIRSIQERLDAWYSANPDKLNMPVLGVFWLGLVQAARR